MITCNQHFLCQPVSQSRCKRLQEPVRGGKGSNGLEGKVSAQFLVIWKRETGPLQKRTFLSTDLLSTGCENLTFREKFEPNQIHLHGGVLLDVTSGSFTMQDLLCMHYLDCAL